MGYQLVVRLLKEANIYVMMSQNEGAWAKKKHFRNNDQNFSKFHGNYKSLSLNPERYEENNTKTHFNNIP